MNDLSNRFKDALTKRVPQFGLWLALADAYSAEVCAGAGFDWLLLDAEHGPNDLRSLLWQLQAIESSSTHPIVRLPVGEAHAVKQILDLGARTLLIPMVDTAPQAQAMAAAVSYPPAGVRGVASGLTRAARWNRIPGYLTRARESICLLVQIESKVGIDNARSIAEVPGVDGIFIGPADLAAALGLLGFPEHEDVQAAILNGLHAIKAGGKAAGIFAASEADARRYLAMGFTFIAVETDIGILAKGTAAAARAYAELRRG